MTAPLLSIADLTIVRSADGMTVLNGVDLAIKAGEIAAVVGESGSGKTMLARTVIGLLPPQLQIAHGAVRFDQMDLRYLPARDWRSVRGAKIGMVFQEPMISLNPALKIGTQMAEAARRHLGLSNAEIRARAIAMLERVKVRDASSSLNRYPHEFSGGLRQRIMLASVLMLKPKLLIADEPTTALDVVVQREVLDIMRDVVRDLGTAVMLITHDLGIVARYADSVSVLRRGELVEAGKVEAILLEPRHAYTRDILQALPKRQPAAPVTADKDLLRVEGLSVSYGARPVLRNVSLTLGRGETLAVVGESGSGKTTLGRAILGLKEAEAGRILFAGTDLRALRGRAVADYRSRLQIVFQDPASSLDPRMSIGTLIGEGLGPRISLSRYERAERIKTVMMEVGLPADWAGRLPHHLSGGQRQRVSLARAIIGNPDIIVADEPVSALDMTIQAQILALFKDLQERRGFSYLFITHDLGVVEEIANRILVLYRGAIVEMGSRDDVLDSPLHPYTRELLAAVPELRQDGAGRYRIAARDLPPLPIVAARAHMPDSGGNAALTELAADHWVLCCSSA